METGVKSKNNNKSAGSDEVIVKMIQVLGPIGMRCLKRLFICVWKNRKTPEEYGRGDIATLFKKGRRREEM